MTTVCRKKRPGGLCLTASRTGLQPSAFTGSSAAITPGTRIPAIPLSLTPQTARYPLPPGGGPHSNPGLLQTKRHSPEDYAVFVGLIRSGALRKRRLCQPVHTGEQQRGQRHELRRLPGFFLRPPFVKSVVIPFHAARAKRG